MSQMGPARVAFHRGLALHREKVGALFAGGAGRQWTQWPRALSNRARDKAVTRASGSDLTEMSPNQLEVKNLRGTECQTQGKNNNNIRCQVKVTPSWD